MDRIFCWAIDKMHDWHWQTWEGCQYLTCTLLEAWPHGFFTRQFQQQTLDELATIMTPEAQTYRVKQVHGNRILGSQDIRQYRQLPKDPERLAFPEADGLVSDDHNQAMWVCTADCTPVLMADAKTGQVAAVHAGWRGTAAKIVPVAIASLQKQGSRIADLRVAMGPAIAGQVYQVSTEVAVEVGASVVDPDAMQAQADVSERLQHLPEPPVLKDEKPGHMRLDVRRVNAMQLEQLGLSGEQVAISPHCTYQDPERFFSYRRDNKKQVQWSGIVSRTPQ
ncbi:Laccase domain protein [Acaryochloris thomasi RCC1774]|uniref:Purine nucleoside phosphorylase n=2 Tax=Acaryochloris TaxID=155977 RepID=A0A2W1JUS1_9CYAN|nr:Laccase domain protein [Acaryochloris thomasi RCC1774]